MKWSDLLGAAIPPSNTRDLYEEARKMQNVFNPAEGPPIPSPKLPTPGSGQALTMMGGGGMQWQQQTMQDTMAHQAMNRRKSWLDLEKPASLSQQKVLAKMSIMLQNDEQIPTIAAIDWFSTFIELMPETEDLVRINLGEVVSTGLDSCFAVKTRFIILIQSLLPKDTDDD